MIWFQNSGVFLLVVFIYQTPKNFMVTILVSKSSSLHIHEEDKESL